MIIGYYRCFFGSSKTFHTIFGGFLPTAAAGRRFAVEPRFGKAPLDAPVPKAVKDRRRDLGWAFKEEAGW